MDRCIRYLEMMVAYNVREGSASSEKRSFWSFRNRPEPRYPVKELRIVASELGDSKEDPIVYLARRVTT